MWLGARGCKEDILQYDLDYLKGNSTGIVPGKSGNGPASGFMNHAVQMNLVTAGSI